MKFFNKRKLRRYSLLEEKMRIQWKRKKSSWNILNSMTISCILFLQMCFYDASVLFHDLLAGLGNMSCHNNAAAGGLNQSPGDSCAVACDIQTFYRSLQMLVHGDFGRVKFDFGTV